MDEKELMERLQKLINRPIDAKLAPVVELVVGLEIAIGHMFNRLARAGVLDLNQEIASLAATRKGLPCPEAHQARAVLRHVEDLLKSFLGPDGALPPQDPKDPRSRFRVIPGGLSEKPSAD